MDGEIKGMIGNIKSKWKRTGNGGRGTPSQDIVGIHS